MVESLVERLEKYLVFSMAETKAAWKVAGMDVAMVERLVDGEVGNWVDSSVDMSACGAVAARAVLWAQLLAA